MKKRFSALFRRLDNGSYGNRQKYINEQRKKIKQYYERALNASNIQTLAINEMNPCMHFMHSFMNDSC